jgi:hypothetical protein
MVHSGGSGGGGGVCLGLRLRRRCEVGVRCHPDGNTEEQRDAVTISQP